MDSFSIDYTDKGNHLVITVTGYFNADAGKQLAAKGQELFDAGKKKFLMDFAACTTVNSPGMSALLDFCVIAMDDYLGKVVFVGLDESKKTFFKIVGIFNVATVADSSEAARKELGV